RRLDVLEVGEDLGEVVVVDRLAVAGDALVDALEVRARVRPHGEARLDEELRHHARRRPLPVGAGEVDDGIGAVRIAEDVHERAHVVEVQTLDPSGAGFDVDVAVEPGQRLGERCGNGCGRHRAPESTYAAMRSFACSTRGRAVSTAWPATLDAASLTFFA